MTDTRSLLPARPLRVLGMYGWIPWRVCKVFAGGVTYFLDIRGETAELEDFGEV